MDEATVRKIIRDELSWLIKNERLIVAKPIQLLDGNHIVLGKTLGNSIGSSPDQKLSFFGSTPNTQAPFEDNASGGTTVDQRCRDLASALRDTLTRFGLMAPP